MYFGSTWKEYAGLAGAPWIAHRLGCEHAYAVEHDNVSCGTPVALRSRRTCSSRRPSCARCSSSAPAASRTCSTTATSARASCSTSATAPWRGCSPRAPTGTCCSARTAITDGSLSLQVKVPSGGSVVAERRRPLSRRRRSGRDEGAPRRRDACQLRRAAAEGALARSGRDARGRLVPVRDPHEAVGARRARRGARRRSRARGVPRRHGPHERRRPAVRARPGRPRGRAGGRATSCSSSPRAPATRGRRRWSAGAPLE